MKATRVIFAAVVALLVQGALFLALPVLDALFNQRPERQKSGLESAREVEILVRRDPPPEKQKPLRNLPQRMPDFRPAAAAKSRAFNMDLALASSDMGDGVLVGGGGMENVVYEAGEVDQPARLLQEGTAQYPARAEREGVAGWVRLYLVVDARGQVRDLQVLAVDPPGYGFEQAALKAMRESRFEPARLRQVPVSQRFTKEYRFVPPF